MSLRAFVLVTAPIDYTEDPVYIGRPLDLTVFGRWLEQTSPSYVYKDRVVRLRIDDVVNGNYDPVLAPLIAGFDSSVQLVVYAILGDFASSPDMRVGKFQTV